MFDPVDPLSAYPFTTPKPMNNNLKTQGLKTLQLMSDRKMRIRAYNIVYFEGMNTDLLTLNTDRLDGWNDVRCVITDDGDVIHNSLATTEPGAYYTKNRMNSKGAFRIQLNTQFKDAWTLGRHYSQFALVQCGNITGHRDNNEDGQRTGDAMDTGDDFYVNQHTTSGATSQVGRWSAGCLVGCYPESHATFMQLCVSSGNRTFDTVVFDGKLLLA